MADTIWDVATAQDVALSNGSLTATNTGDCNVQGVVGTISKSSGKWYYEFTVNAITANFVTQTLNVGVTVPLGDFTTYNEFANKALGGVGVDSRGVIWSNGSASPWALNLGVQVPPGLRAGDTVGVAIDLDNHHAWYEVVAGPSFPNPLGWNGDNSPPASDPATNTKGANIPTTGAFTPVIAFNDDDLTQAVTFNFGATPFVGVALGWNPNDKSANFTLSNSTLTATTTTATLGAVRSITSHNTGKWYVEFTTGNQAGTDTGVGIATSSANLGTIGSVAAGGFITFGDTGTIYFNGSPAPGFPTTGFSGSNSVVCMAIDLVNGKGWFRNTNHGWLNDVIGNQNPATNTGGVDISALFPTNAAFLCFCSNTQTSVTTVNLGNQPFTYTAPSGFSAWGTASNVLPSSFLAWGGTLDPTTIWKTTLSNGNLTATNAQILIPEQGVLADQAWTSGKRYFEVTNGVINDSDTGVGVALSSIDYITFQLNGTGGIAYFIDLGQVYSDGSFIGAADSGSSPGDVVAFAIDLDNRQAWFKLVGGPDAPFSNGWNDNPGNDPATNVGGLAIPAGAMLPATVFGGFQGDVAGNSLTTNFCGPFVGTLPEGFERWCPAAPPPVIPAVYRLLVPHWLAIGYAVGGTVVTEGIEIPIGWEPTMACEPLNATAIQAYWDAGPRYAAGAEYGEDFFIFPIAQKPTIYWQPLGPLGYFQLTGAGASLGAKASG